MPPWHADPRYGHFANDRSLTATERATLLTWVDHGTPLGEIKDVLARARSFPKAGRPPGPMPSSNFPRRTTYPLKASSLTSISGCPRISRKTTGSRRPRPSRAIAQSFTILSFTSWIPRVQARGDSVPTTSVGYAPATAKCRRSLPAGNGQENPRPAPISCPPGALHAHRPRSHRDRSEGAGIRHRPSQLAKRSRIAHRQPRPSLIPPKAPTTLQKSCLLLPGPPQGGSRLELHAAHAPARAVVQIHVHQAWPDTRGHPFSARL